MAEQVLNFAWLAIAIFAFAVVLPSCKRQRRAQAAVALIGTVALLFPIISISDDFSADKAIQDVVAILLTVGAVVVMLRAVARVGTVAPVAFRGTTLDLSDPRSPPLA